MSSRQQATLRVQEAMRHVIAMSVINNEQIAKRVGLLLVDLQALGVINATGAPMTPGEVGAATSLPSSTTTRVLDRLEKAGYVRRIPEPSDRRKVLIEVDQEKLALLGSEYGPIVDGLAAVGKRFTVEQLTVVAEYLEAIGSVR